MKPPLVEEVAAAILDGTAVDWASVDSGVEQGDRASGAHAALRQVKAQPDENVAVGLAILESTLEGFDCRLDAAGFDPGEVEEGVDEPTRPLKIVSALRHLLKDSEAVTLSPVSSLDALGRPGAWLWFRD